MNTDLPNSQPILPPTSWTDRFDGDDPNWAVAATDTNWSQNVTEEPTLRKRVATPEPVAPPRPEEFRPLEPSDLRATGLHPSLIEGLILKFMLNVGQATGRDIAKQVALPFRLVDPILERMKGEQLLAREAAGQFGDFVYGVTVTGHERGRRYSTQNTYCGAAPVNLDEYIQSVQKQSLSQQKPRWETVREAFRELVLSEDQLLTIGEALNLGRGFFVYGPPGNGKTSIAHAAIRAYSPYIWIPRAIHLSGEILRLYDPMLHIVAPTEESGPAFDQRWIRICRPVLLVGGDLQLSSLDVTTNPTTQINEAPLQMKCNNGVLVFDDFGRYRFSIESLLNRLVVPLERRQDCLHLNSGRAFSIPFDPLVVFSTNLQPCDIVDEAFLRRIPYKFEVASPTEDQLSLVFLTEARKAKLTCNREAIEYLLNNCYRNGRYAMRFSHARDLVRHIANACEFRQLPLQVTPSLIDAAVATCLGNALLLKSVDEHTRRA